MLSGAHYDRIADLYDSFVQTGLDIPFFLNEAKTADGEILELMAGTGRVTLPLLEAGLKVTCVDVSAAMLARLRRKLAAPGVTADLHQVDIRHLNLRKRFQQIIIPFQAFPELTGAEDQNRALKRIYDHLADSGTFICTLHNPAVRLKSVDGQHHLVGRFPLEKGHLFVWLLQTYDQQTCVVNVLEFFEEYDVRGSLRAKRFSEVQFHLLQKSVFEERISAAGFHVAHLYGDYAYAPFDEDNSPFMIWVLRRSV